jgi:hypothetical protein
MIALALAPPAWAQTTGDDPRDQQIRELQQRLEDQSKQIDDLRKSIEDLKGVVNTPRPALPEPATEEPEQAPAVTREEDEDPGPEPPPPLEAGSTPPSSSGTGQQPSMNPNISVIGLFEGKAGGPEYDPTRDSFYLREVELALQAPIDPYAQADIYLTWPSRESPEVEEATLTWTGLPAGLQAKAGLLKGDFGRINQLHTHALPQIDVPLPNQAVFGPESLHDPGVEVSWLAPTSWYSRFSMQALSRSVGPTADEFGALDLTDPAYREHLADQLAAGDEFSTFPADGSKSLLLLGRWENLFDLSEDTTFQIGMSGATSEIGGVELQKASAYGADATLKWRPLDNPNTSLVWQTEFLRAHQAFTGDNRDYGGWYTFLNYQWARNWSAGVRYDMTELPFDPSLEHRRASALLEWSPSEWNKLRLQYNHNWTNYHPSYDELLLQWNIVLGPHGAHKY